jgi:hypothetical protein
VFRIAGSSPHIMLDHLVHVVERVRRQNEWDR